MIVRVSGLSVVFWLVLVDLTAAIDQLNVAYPERDNQNYSVVTLSCQDGAFFVENAIYQRNGVDLETQVLVIDETDEEVTFVFTQDQEGWFTCGGSTSDISPSVGLAGRS